MTPSPKVEEIFKQIKQLSQAEKLVLNRLLAEVAADDMVYLHPSSKRVTPLEAVVQTSTAPIIQNVAELAADVWPEDESVDEFLEFRRQQREIDLALEEERFKRLFGEDE